MAARWRIPLANVNSTTASPEKGHMRSRKSRGMTLIELLVCMTVFVMASTIAVVNMKLAFAQSRVNTAYNLSLMTMRRARQTAIDNRKTYIVTFVVPRTIQVYRQDGGTPLPAPILLNTYTLPTDIQFRNEPGIPTTPSQTPDQFGSGAYAVDFDVNVGGGAGTSVYFRPDGGAYDALGNVNNGVVYIARQGDLMSSRAITLFGLSGRLRGWRLYPNASSGTTGWQPQ